MEVAGKHRWTAAPPSMNYVLSRQDFRLSGQRVELRCREALISSSCSGAFLPTHHPMEIDK